MPTALGCANKLLEQQSLNTYQFISNGLYERHRTLSVFFQNVRWRSSQVRCAIKPTNTTHYSQELRTGNPKLLNLSSCTINNYKPNTFCSVYFIYLLDEKISKECHLGWQRLEDQLLRAAWATK